eukprot:CAMPEP_0170515210 /NCGR_PEP_ID=MMETSP0209-20121228/1673_1 /TAXON_ID=665100 ORGANISM="Litonotus pictus, Strain P1" /NCGR_SAMPLE_ID=MMETSP0209 /ASSEMBLY_ACC=CAM_ASM_000301 /LENGTH=201 /DNA_ID=CAMNT_0010799593 /DNA_START=1 /DNA_END=609 /DNA_ORIENTATION=+
MDSNEEQSVKTYSFKVVILGDVGVGKSSIAHRFVSGNMNTLYEPTIGALFLSKKIQVQEHMIKFDIWDTAGQEKFRSLAPIYYRKADVAIVVYDVTSVQSFEGAKKWVEELHERASSGIIINICGNKLDLSESRRVDEEEAKQYAQRIGSYYTEVSAKTNQNIYSLFEDIALRIPKEVKEEDDLSMNIDTENTKRGSCGYC